MRKVLLKFAVSATDSISVCHKSINGIDLLTATTIGINTNDGRDYVLTVTSGQAPAIIERIEEAIVEANVRCLKHSTEKLPAAISVDVTDITSIAAGA